ncbi:MAG TPA: hypothetical protein VGD17_15530 [Chitinophagaceae bacterium]
MKPKIYYRIFSTAPADSSPPLTPDLYLQMIHKYIRELTNHQFH